MAKPEGLPEMTYRFLGRSGLQVSAISLGGWLTYGGHVDEGESRETGENHGVTNTEPRRHFRLHEGRLRLRYQLLRLG